MGTRWKGTTILVALAAGMLAAAGPATGQNAAAGTSVELTWRMSTNIASVTPPVFERRGVLVAGSGEPGTVYVRMVAPQPPSGGRWMLSNRLLLRFEDGSTLTMEYPSEVRTNGDNSVVAGTYTFDGEVVGGTGRFAGASGTLRLQATVGLDRTRPGVLGDNFATGAARFTLAPR